MLASAAGALAAMLYLWHRYAKPDVAMACNGLLGGLVAITASCAFVTPAAAVVIGAVAGLLVVAAVIELERRFHIDDPVGAIAVHGVCGMWGALALGLFADGSYGDGWNGVSGPVRGLLFGDASQFIAQLIGVTVNLVVVFSLALTFFVISTGPSATEFRRKSNGPASTRSKWQRRLSERLSELLGGVVIGSPKSSPASATGW